MFHYDYLTNGTCSKIISLDVKDGRIYNVKFMGGCDGNLKAIPILVDGMTVEDVEAKLSGVRCGRRPTSCAHQLTLAAKEALNASLANQ